MESCCEFGKVFPTCYCNGDIIAIGFQNLAFRFSKNESPLFPRNGTGDCHICCENQYFIIFPFIIAFLEPFFVTTDWSKHYYNGRIAVSSAVLIELFQKPYEIEENCIGNSRCTRIWGNIKWSFWTQKTSRIKMFAFNVKILYYRKVLLTSLTRVKGKQKNTQDTKSIFYFHAKRRTFLTLSPCTIKLIL